ncbi:hypothetical protein C8Q77DRAFT_599869 [Trametes polyzona]|nr:hypothetical protein C8Q77DRAFT_599869 [Trametes polyzona]
MVRLPPPLFSKFLPLSFPEPRPVGACNRAGGARQTGSTRCATPKESDDAAAERAGRRNRFESEARRARRSPEALISFGERAPQTRNMVVLVCACECSATVIVCLGLAHGSKKLFRVLLCANTGSFVTLGSCDLLRSATSSGPKSLTARTSSTPSRSSRQALAVEAETGPLWAPGYLELRGDGVRRSDVERAAASPRTSRSIARSPGRVARPPHIGSPRHPSNPHPTGTHASAPQPITTAAPRLGPERARHRALPDAEGVCQTASRPMNALRPLHSSSSTHSSRGHAWVTLLAAKPSADGTHSERQHPTAFIGHPTRPTL